MSTKIIYQRRVQLDHWPQVIDSGLLDNALQTPQAKVLVNAQQWSSRQQNILLQAKLHKLAIGVALDTSSDIAILEPGLAIIALIKLQFAGFADGRGYSHAHTLRHVHGFKGELRAVNVERDNLALLEQCGFDAFELAPEVAPETALSAFDEIDFAHARGFNANKRNPTPVLIGG